MRYLLVALLLIAVPAICATNGNIYKWVDEKGQSGYADDLGKVPERYRDNAVLIEKQDQQAVEIIEKYTPEKTVPKAGESRDATPAAKEVPKEKKLYGGKDGAAWKLDFARQRHEVKSLEEHLATNKERMADGNKLSRGEYLSLQNTQRDLEVRIAKAKKKLDAITEAADQAAVPAEFR